MKYYIRFVLLAFLIGAPNLGCNSDTDPVLICGVIDPVSELEWMKELIETIEETELGRETSYLSKSIIDGETVIVKGSCCMNCNWAPIFYNCQGERMEELDYTDFQEREWEVIWTASSSTCEFD